MEKKVCPYCHKSDKVRKYGHYEWKTKTQRWACFRCKRTFH